MSKSRERGAVTIEFALVIPLLLLLILAVIEFGFRYERGTVLNNASFIAARDMSIHHDTATAQAAATNAGAPAGATFSVSYSNGSGCPATPGATPVLVTVTMSATMTSPTKAFGSTFAVTGKGVARCDG